MSAVAQLDLLQFAAEEALRRRDLGMARVLESSDAVYRDRLLGAIEILAMHGDPFTADDARAMIGDPPKGTHPNIAGAVFNAASKAGVIRMVGFGHSARICGNNNTVRVWRGAWQ